MTKDIIALLPEAETVASCLDCATAAARRLPSRVRALHVGFNPRVSVLSAEEMDLQWLREGAEGRLEVRQAKIRAAFDAWVAAAGASAPPVAWNDDQGDVGAVVASAAARADLVVMANPRNLDARDALHSTLFWAQRLMLVAPPRPDAGPRTVGRHIVIGWKTGAPVERAVRAGIDWLRRADRLTVVCVTKPGTEPYERRAREVMAELALAAEIVSIPKTGPSVGRQLLGEAIRRDADSLLIGAFKHGELWESLLGGVTRDVLAAASIPVFLAA